MEMRLAGPASIWATGLGIGMRVFPREPVLGLKRLALPVSYWRAAEFAYVGRRLRLAPGATVLDLGSPKDLAAMLARHKGYHVIATDILPEAIELSRRYARPQGLDGEGPGLVRSEVQDGRRLTYADGEFDAAFSVSVLEHIPDRGDGEALRELVRVVKPGGAIVLTVPFDRRYRETWVDGPVYERQTPERNFFERHYCPESLQSRLLAASGAVVEDLEIWGERRLRMERLLHRSGWLRNVLSPAEAFLSAAFLRRLDRPDAPDVHPMAAFATLRKPS